MMAYPCVVCLNIFDSEEEFLGHRHQPGFAGEIFYDVRTGKAINAKRASVADQSSEIQGSNSVENRGSNPAVEREAPQEGI